MGCGASSENDKYRKRSSDEMEDDEEDDVIKETPEERQARKERIKEHRENLIIMKRNEVDVETMLESPIVSSLIAISESSAVPCIIISSDGALLHLNKLLSDILNGDAVSYRTGTLTSNFIEFGDKLGSPPSFKLLDDFLEEEIPITLLVSEAPPYSTTCSVTKLQGPSFDVFMLMIQQESAPISLHSSLDPESSGEKRRDRSPRNKANVDIRRLTLDDSSDTGSESGGSRSSISSLPSSILRRLDRNRPMPHGDFIITIDSNCIIRSISHGAQKLLQVVADDVIDKHANVLLEDGEPSMADDLLAGEIEVKTDEKKYSFAAANGSIERVSIASITDVTVDGTTLHVVRFRSRESSKKKKIGFASKGTLSDEMVALLEQHSSCVIVAQLNGEIIYGNENCLRELGYREEEILNEDLSIVVPFPFRLYHPEAVRYLYSRISPSFFRSKRYVVALSRRGDIVPICIEIIDFQTVNSRMLYLAYFRRAPVEEVQDNKQLKELISRAAADERNTESSIEQDLRLRAERHLKDRRSSVRRQRSPRRPESRRASPRIPVQKAGFEEAGTGPEVLLDRDLAGSLMQSHDYEEPKKVISQKCPEPNNDAESEKDGGDADNEGDTALAAKIMKKSSFERLKGASSSPKDATSFGKEVKD